MSATITRFAPSPSGYLHLGHLYAALTARRLADEAGGEMRLRIEDIDTGRCREEYRRAIFDDMEFMGLTWQGAVMVQSDRLPHHKAALESLKARGLVYPCFLVRRELNALLSAPHDSPKNTDRHIDPAIREAREQGGEAPAWRLRMEAAKPLLARLDWCDHGKGRIAVDFDSIGDAVIARKDIATSYHLGVVVDDAAQGVSLVSRADDLRGSTPLHRILQALLDLPETTWLHHGMVAGADGERLAKRKGAHSITAMRRAGMGRGDILAALEACKLIHS